MEHGDHIRNAVVSVILVGVVYNALRPVLLRSGLIHMKRNGCLTMRQSSTIT